MKNVIIGVVVIAIAIVFCLLLAIANFSGDRFFEKYEKLNGVMPDCPIYPLEFVNDINRKHFNNSLKIGKTDKKAGDAYAKGFLILSNETLSTPSLASLTIISHEMGHAKQDREGNKLTSLNRLRRLGRVLGAFLLPFLIAGGLIMLLSKELFYLGVGLACGGALIFLIALFVKLKTISIEKEASKFALIYLADYLNDNEVEECGKFLKDARMTYWADFLRTLFFWTFLTKKSKFFN